MPAIPTPNLGLTVPTVGADFGTWGSELNGNLAILDELGAAGVFNISANSAASLPIFPRTIIRVTTGGSTIVFSLLPPAQCPGRSWLIKMIDSTGGSVSIVGPIDGQTSYEIDNQFSYVEVMSNGATYDVIANG
jgi:hypothetical protein